MTWRQVARRLAHEWAAGLARIAIITIDQALTKFSPTR